MDTEDTCADCAQCGAENVELTSSPLDEEFGRDPEMICEECADQENPWV